MWDAPASLATLAYDQKASRIRDNLHSLSATEIPSTETKTTTSNGEKKEDIAMAMQEVSFDPDKTLCCGVENGHTLVHGTGGRGYGLGSTAVSSGCYQWKVSIICWVAMVKEKAGL